MKRWIRPAALSAGLAAFAIALLIDSWNPARAALYALGWAIVTGLLVFTEWRTQQ
ncbi:hypothetical protein [Nocardia niigatensis]|uniref:hypothetical protein n=1 Tax=Nocardia niigatensis TaxID=209249 RepID=UPI0002E0B779|nr:hypothetical protein [Nocardia niigatensis]